MIFIHKLDLYTNKINVKQMKLITFSFIKKLTEIYTVYIEYNKNSK